MLNTYIGFDRHAGSQEAACLVFAHTAKEARKLAHRTVRGWMDGSWLDTAVRRLRDMPWLYAEGNPSKLASDTPHVIECPTTCPTCDVWGIERDVEGRCTNCMETGPNATEISGERSESAALSGSAVTNKAP
jgi:hypothetical protein